MKIAASSFFRCALLLVLAVNLFACSGNSTPATSSTWQVSDTTTADANQTATLFDAGQLYFNVQSTVVGSGEVRGEITPLATYPLDNGDPFAANPSNLPVTFSTVLSGDQVRPRNVITSAVGYGSLTLDPASNLVTGFIVTSGITATSAQIGDGLPGDSGAAVIPLEGGPVIWTIPANTVLSDQQEARLASGAYYFSVASASFPAGEIRGQLNQQVRSASLKGSSEVPPVTTSASGTGILAMKSSTRQFSGFVKLTGLSSPVRSVALQIGAAGSNGIVIATLVNRGNGLWTLPVNTFLGAPQIVSFNNGELYFNVITDAHPNGELRGQLLSGDVKIGTSVLNGAKEVPPVTTQGSGTGMLALNTVNGQLYGSVNTDKVAGTLARIHSGPAGTNGPVVAAMTSASPVATAPAPGISFALDIQPIFNASCVAQICHVPGGISPSGTPPMSLLPDVAYENTLPRVTPGNSAASYFVSRLDGSFPPRMPLGAPALPATSIDLIKAWIDAGALDN